MFWLGFYIGCCIGAIFGWFFAVILIASRETQREREIFREYREILDESNTSV